MSFDKKTIDKLTETQMGMVRLKSWLFDNPDIEGTLYGCTFSISTTVRDESWRDLTIEEVAQRVRAMSRRQPLGSVRKQHSDTYTEYTLSLGGAAKVQMYVPKATTCERIVTGTEKVLVTDPNAPKIEVEREIVTWECAPILEQAEVSG